MQDNIRHHLCWAWIPLVGATSDWKLVASCARVGRAWERLHYEARLAATCADLGRFVGAVLQTKTGHYLC